MSTAIRYSQLCAIGVQRNKALAHCRADLTTAGFAYQDDESSSRLAASLEAARSQFKDAGVELSRHVAHCLDGCKRDDGQEPSASMHQWNRAPTHDKPLLPRMSELAARLRDGEALEAIAEEFNRNPDTLRQRITSAGFSSRDGRPVVPPTRTRHADRGISILPDEPWRDDALCAQTDPEAFYPEKGGSTREAKSVCAMCTVSAECLDYALEHDERHGIWGGLSERDRRKVAKALKGEPNLDTTQEAS